MPFRPRWTAEAAGQFAKLQAAAQKSTDKGSVAKQSAAKKAKPSKAAGLFKQVEKCVRLLLENPRHPGLNTHEFTSIEHPYDPKAKVFEAYVQNNTPGVYRLFWYYGPESGDITILVITPHP